MINRIIYIGTYKEAAIFARNNGFGFERLRIEGKPHVIVANDENTKGHSRKTTLYLTPDHRNLDEGELQILNACLCRFEKYTGAEVCLVSEED